MLVLPQLIHSRVLSTPDTLLKRKVEHGKRYSATVLLITPAVINLHCIHLNVFRVYLFTGPTWFDQSVKERLKSHLFV